MTPEVSVVIPTRNRWELLSRHALPSALEQVDVELEVIVVDEASSDGTARGLAGVSDERLRVVRNGVPLRLPGARNEGARHARGAWLAFLDDDDLWAPTKLRCQLDAALRDGSDWVYARTIVVDESVRPLEDDPFPEPERLRQELDRGNWVPGGGSNVLVSARAFAATGGFDPTLRFFEDWDLWLRLLERGLPSAVDELVVARVEHGANMVLRSRHEVEAAFETVVARRRPVTGDDRRGVREWLAVEQARAGYPLRAALMFLATGVRFRSPGNLVASVAALGGTTGLRAADSLLMRVRGSSHLDVVRPTPASDPAWLARFRR
jgi:glycosyltransferase involved in cell wall biosynthesis